MPLDEGANQVRYADNLAAVDHLIGLNKYFDSLVSLGPSYEFYVNEEKTWLVVKCDYLNQARPVLNDTRVNYPVYTGRFKLVRNRFQLLSGLIEVSVNTPKSISKRLESDLNRFV